LLTFYATHKKWYNWATLSSESDLKQPNLFLFSFYLLKLKACWILQYTENSMAKDNAINNDFTSISLLFQGRKWCSSGKHPKSKTSKTLKIALFSHNISTKIITCPFHLASLKLSPHWLTCRWNLVKKLIKIAISWHLWEIKNENISRR
jgi:hypothetical protein